MFLSQLKVTLLFLLCITCISCGQRNPAYCPREMLQIVLVDAQMVFIDTLQTEICEAAEKKCQLRNFVQDTTSSAPYLHACVTTAQYKIRLYTPSSFDAVQEYEFSVAADSWLWRERNTCIGILEINASKEKQLPINTICSEDEYVTALKRV